MFHRISVILISILVGSCSTTFTHVRSDGKVVERSKEARPNWVEAPHAKLISDANESRMHFENLRQRDLPVAVKLTQSYAMEASYVAWKPLVAQRVGSFQGVVGLLNDRNRAEFDKISETMIRKLHSDLTAIEDIYYEKIETDPTAELNELKGAKEYFDVHVSIRIKGLLDEALRQAMVSSFAKSKDSQLRRLGSVTRPAPP
jgi:hypothetical protein